MFVDPMCVAVLPVAIAPLFTRASIPPRNAAASPMPRKILLIDDDRLQHRLNPDELGELLAEGRLRNQQLSRRLREAAALDDLHEIPQLAHVHHAGE